MKKLFRSVNLVVLLAAIMALGAVAGFAQAACTDAAGITDLDAKVRAAWADKTIAGRENFVNTGKQFLEKYGDCDSQKEFADWLKIKVPETETKTLPKMREDDVRNKLIGRFNTGLSSKNWDEVFAAGKEILNKWPDEFKEVEFVLGTIAYDELYNKSNSKYNEDTLRFAKMALADMDAGKAFKDYGIPKTDFYYKTKEEASGWLNLIVGYITQNGQKNKKDAQPYLYKATQINSTAAKQPIPFEMMGLYYFDERDKIATQITALAASQSDSDTPEVAKQKVADIEGKVALANGYAERAMDAFARAYTLGVAKAYKDLMYKNLELAFKARYGKTDALTQAWIADAVKKPLPNPTTPVTPIADPKPAATTTTGSTTTTTTTTTGKPISTTPVSNPAAPPKPAGTPAKPSGGTLAKPSKRQASIKSAVAKKRG